MKTLFLSRVWLVLLLLSLLPGSAFADNQKFWYFPHDPPAGLDGAWGNSNITTSTNCTPGDFHTMSWYTRGQASYQGVNYVITNRLHYCSLNGSAEPWGCDGNCDAGVGTGCLGAIIVRPYGIDQPNEYVGSYDHSRNYWDAGKPCAQWYGVGGYCHLPVARACTYTLGWDPGQGTNGSGYTNFLNSYEVACNPPNGTLSNLLEIGDADYIMTAAYAELFKKPPADESLNTWTRVVVAWGVYSPGTGTNCSVSWCYKNVF